MSGVLARLGDVLYWLFSGLALVVLFGGVLQVIFVIFGVEKLAEGTAGLFVGAVVLWLIGRAARYILAGR